jgi:holo-[acyl-carrier protein] synthase
VILGHGVDAVEIDRIRRALMRHRGFGVRVFSERELAASSRRGAGAAAYLAKRWAAKEAAAKALGVGFSGFRYPEIEVGNRRSGAPELLLSGEFAAWAARVGVRSWHVSLSDTREMAFASVIAEGEPPGAEPGLPPWIVRRHGRARAGRAQG